jgi:hypothetical protein
MTTQACGARSRVGDRLWVVIEDSVRFRSSSVILRCSPSFTASLEGWATSARGHPSRRRAYARLLRMTVPYDGAMVCLTFSTNALSAKGFGRKANCSSSRKTLLSKASSA